LPSIKGGTLDEARRSVFSPGTTQPSLERKDSSAYPAAKKYFKKPGESRKNFYEIMEVQDLIDANRNDRSR
jgi:hypothetical protein